MTSNNRRKISKYPFSRREKSRYEGWEKYSCKICGGSDYSHPNSPDWKKKICVDCNLNHIVSTDIINCAKHGEYVGYKTENGTLLGSCPTCHEENMKDKKANGCGCLMFGILGSIIIFAVAIILFI